MKILSGIYSITLAERKKHARDMQVKEQQWGHYLKVDAAFMSYYTDQNKEYPSKPSVMNARWKHKHGL